MRYPGADAGVIIRAEGSVATFVCFSVAIIVETVADLYTWKHLSYALSKGAAAAGLGASLADADTFGTFRTGVTILRMVVILKSTAIFIIAIGSSTNVIRILFITC